ncbi:MAG: PEP-CTERM sorting domain-containing protein [Candidatus Acidiferrales bacterium]
MKAKFAMVALGALLFATAPVFASGVNFDFSTPAGTLGVSQTYTSNSVTITAYGFSACSGGITVALTSCSRNDLYGKTSGGDENGLGLTGTSDFEIGTNQMVQLDLTNLINAGATSVTLQIGSVQPGEGYDIWEGSSLGSSGSLVITNGQLDETPFTVNLNSKDPYLGVSAYADDVLLSSLAASPTPEPGTLALLGTGLLGFGFGLRRRFANHSA